MALYAVKDHVMLKNANVHVTGIGKGSHHSMHNYCINTCEKW
jgi:hypothetical protein